jgi:hypothetical protein
MSVTITKTENFLQRGPNIALFCKTWEQEDALDSRCREDLINFNTANKPKTANCVRIKLRYLLFWGRAVAQLVEALRYKPERRGLELIH